MKLGRDCICKPKDDSITEITDLFSNFDNLSYQIDNCLNDRNNNITDNKNCDFRHSNVLRNNNVESGNLKSGDSSMKGGEK
jgi:hypothetical protein